MASLEVDNTNKQLEKKNHLLQNIQVFMIEKNMQIIVKESG